MKLKIISFATMKPGHTYISEDLEHIYKVSKTYGGNNSSVDIFELDYDEYSFYPKYSRYSLEEEHKISNGNPKLKVYDLGTKSIYYRNGYDELIHTKIDKVMSDFSRFINSIK